MKFLAASFVIACLGLGGCKSKVAPPSAAQQEAILQDAPHVFTDDRPHPGLRGLDGVYLGQSKSDALERLHDWCPDPMDYKGGDFAERAWFRGCVLREPDGPISSVRLGFWPRLDNRLATLEVKRSDIDLPAVRERFRNRVDQVTFDVPHPGIVEMHSPNYQLLADADEGADGPIHITVGFTQQWANQHASKPH